jgi:hypothetical protein
MTTVELRVICMYVCRAADEARIEIIRTQNKRVAFICCFVLSHSVNSFIRNTTILLSEHCVYMSVWVDGWVVQACKQNYYFYFRSFSVNTQFYSTQRHDANKIIKLKPMIN